MLSLLTQLLGTSLVFFGIARLSTVSVADFGLLTYAFAAAQLFAVVFEFGLVTYLSKRTAENSVGSSLPGAAKASYGLHLVLMAFGFFVLATYFSSIENSTLELMVCLYVGASVFVTTSLRFFYAFYLGREKLHLEFISSLSEFLVLLFVLVAAFVFEAGILEIAQLFLVARVVSWFVVYAIFGVFDSWLYPAFDLVIWKETFLGAAPFAATFVIAFALTSIDTIMLRQMSGGLDADTSVGLYQAALRLILVPGILAVVATRVLLPYLTRLLAQGEPNLLGKLRMLNNLLLMAALLFSVFLYAKASYLVETIYGMNYAESAGLVKVLSLTILLRFGAAYNLYFMLYNKMWHRAVFALVALCSSVVMNWFLIPTFGVLGVVWASVITHFLHWIPYLIYMKMYESDPFLGWNWVVAIPLAGLFFLLINSIENMMLSLMFAGIYGLCALSIVVGAEAREELIQVVADFSKGRK
jgi:O-antigen/teichoic acid export membrane protein